MLRIIWLATLALLLFAYRAQAQVWTARNPVVGRAGVYQFVINGVAYVGGGEDDQQSYADLYAYDPTADQWTPRAALPGAGRAVAATFVLGGQAYVVSGTTFSGGSVTQLLTDTWRYDPITDQWTARAALPGAGRLGAAGFAIGPMGYVGGGMNFDAIQSFSDFYAYDPASDQWTSRAALPTQDTGLGASFAVGNYGYVAGGLRLGTVGSMSVSQQTWRYDPATNQWISRADLPAPRAYSSALTTGGFGYVAEGVGNLNLPPTPAHSTLRYDATVNVWTTVTTNGPGIGRAVPVFFAVQNALYLGGGIDLATNAMLTDFWQLPGSVVTGRAADIVPGIGFSLVPNPAHAESVRLLGVPAASLTVVDSHGRLVQSYPVAPATLNVRDLTAGLYLVRCGNFTRRLVVE